MNDKVADNQAPLTEEEEERIFNEVIGEDDGSENKIEDNQDKQEQEQEESAEEEQEVLNAEDEENNENEEQVESDLQHILEDNKKLRQQLLTQSGRASKAQRELNRLLAEQNEPKITAPVLDPETGLFGDGWDALKDEFGDLGLDKIENIMTAQQEQIAALNDNLYKTKAEIQQAEIDRFKKSQMSVVSSNHPDFVEVVNSAEFNKWCATLPDETQELIVSSYDADEVNTILDTFKAETGYRSKKQVQEKAEKIAAKRKKRTASSLGVETRAASAPVADNLKPAIDEDAIYKEVWGISP